ncbi:MAG: FliM/FliN family flagellar motor C-terminal domain-containing protein [Loktanella sp.]|nr:FliM/FliN family flagellar motor C-terminal domain-containing protein [Loktanella sp.]
MTVLRRKLGKGPQDAPPVPLTASRAMRLALSRAAQQAAGLSLSVGGIAVDVVPLDNLLGDLSDTMLLQHLRSKDGLAGVCALDPSLVQALVEVRTTGKLQLATTDDRPITGTDARLAQPMVVGLLSELNAAATGTVLDGWVDGVSCGDRTPSVRSLGLDLPDTGYRCLSVEIDLGVDGRQARLVLALPAPGKVVKDTPAAPAPPQLDWSDRFQAAVLPAPAALTAVVHRMTLSLATVQALHAGQTVKLSGCTTGSVRLETVKGQLFARGRLGQMAGKVAVRLEPDAGPAMVDMPPRREVAQLAPSDTS